MVVFVHTHCKLSTSPLYFDKKSALICGPQFLDTSMLIVIGIPLNIFLSLPKKYVTTYLVLLVHKVNLIRISQRLWWVKIRVASKEGLVRVVEMQAGDGDGRVEQRSYQLLRAVQFLVIFHQHFDRHLAGRIS